MGKKIPVLFANKLADRLLADRLEKDGELGKGVDKPSEEQVKKAESEVPPLKRLNGF